MEKSVIQKLRDLRTGKKISFPIKQLLTVRNNVSVLNAQHMIEGKKWISFSNPQKGIVTVQREK